MAKITLLDKEIAEQIAAGEVVERPAAVIKELTENSIDAGATLITVEVRHGGVTYMRVSDNGSGIAREDVAKAFLRHATSKISTAEDLEHIGTLGFRGEALASIAAMCRVEVLTRAKDQQEGTRYVIHGSQEVENSPQGSPQGTSIIVKDIFYNTPARMKFLKKDVAEASAITLIVEKLALAHPEISFKLIRDGQIKLQTSGDGKLLSTIHAIHGKEVCETLLEVSYQYNNISVTGFVSKPTAAKANRGLQNFFINNRYVKTRTAAAAVEEAFKHSMMTGRFPACFLNLTIGFTEVDVNVHPAKTEVRFTSEKAVFDSVYYGVKSALSSYDNTAPAKKSIGNFYVRDKAIENPVQERFSAQQYRALAQQAVKFYAPSEEHNTPLPLADSTCKEGKTIFAENTSCIQCAQTQKAQRWDKEPLKEEAGQLDFAQSFSSAACPDKQKQARQTPSALAAAPPQSTMPADDKPQKATQPNAPTQTADESRASKRYADARLIGELFSTYIVLQTGEQMVFVDKHAAHERLIFNRLVESPDSLPSQTLIAPVVVHLAKDVYASAVERLNAFVQFGLTVEDFGEGDLLVREVPILLSGQDIVAIVEEIADKLHHNHNDLTPEVLYDILHRMACRSAVMGGESTAPAELEELVELLRKNEDVKYCPHGRPVAIAFTKQELEKRFGRLQ